MILCPIHEHNGCHFPAGSPTGGEFCSRAQGVVGPTDRVVNLPEDPRAYFKLDDAHVVLVPVSKLRTIRARPEGVAHAAELMAKAAAGLQAKRKPIQVTRRPDGFFDVVDGNSTANIARRAGWQRIPVHVAVEDTRRKGGPTQFVGRNKSGLR